MLNLTTTLRNPTTIKQIYLVRNYNIEGKSFVVRPFQQRMVMSRKMYFR